MDPTSILKVREQISSNGRQLFMSFHDDLCTSLIYILHTRIIRQNTFPHGVCVFWEDVRVSTFSATLARARIYRRVTTECRDTSPHYSNIAK